MTTIENSEDASGNKDEHASYPRPAYAWYVVVLMMCFYVLSFMDRQIIAVLLEPIKADLALTDVQISLIGGISFTIFYSVAGIFIGRLADSLNRPLLIAVGVFVWSLTTAACGLIGKFWQLFILRMGVGLGESALLPSTLSLLSDYFSPKRLATPTSVFLFGAPIGIGLSFAIGGYLYSVATEIANSTGWEDVVFIGGSAAWKLVLLFLGVVGMLMTILLVTVREPRNSEQRKARGEPKNVAKVADAATLDEVKKYSKQNWIPITALYFCMALISLAAYAQGFWDITFLGRTYDWDPATGSFWYGMVQMFAGLSGMLSGGVIADQLSKRGVQGASVILVLIGAGFSIPFSFLYPFAETPTMALTLMVFAIFGSNMCFACAASAVQRLFPIAMLGLAAGVYYFISNAIGIGVGPTLVAGLTDYVYEDPQKINYSLAMVGGFSRALAFLCLLAGFKHYRDLMIRRDSEAQ